MTDVSATGQGSRRDSEQTRCDFHAAAFWRLHIHEHGGHVVSRRAPHIYARGKTVRVHVACMCTHLCMHVCMRLYVFICVCACLCVYKLVKACIRVCSHVSGRVWACVF